MRVFLLTAAIFTAGIGFADVPAIKEAEGVIVTGLNTEAAKFRLKEVVASNCQVLTESINQSVSYFCDASSGELSIEISGAVKSTPISKVLVYQSTDENGRQVFIHRFRTIWQAEIGGFPIESMAWLVLSDLDAPEGELDGNFTIKRTDQSFPVLARWVD